MARNRDRLYEMLEEGLLEAKTLAGDLLGFLSEDDCAEFAERNGIELWPEEDDETEDGETDNDND